MTDGKSPKARSGARFTSLCCDDLEIREEDTRPGPGLNEKSSLRLRDKYGGKMPPPSDPSEPDILEIREEDTQPGTVTQRTRKSLEE